MADNDADNIVQFPDSMGLAGPSRGDQGGGIGGAVVTTVLDGGNEVMVYPSGVVVIVAPAKISYNYDEDDFNQNLAERLDDGALGGLADEIIEGVQADIQTRSDLVAQYQEGIDLLGTKLEAVSTPSTASRSVSRVGHPLLLESMIQFHAGAEAELLPVEGPAKVMTIGTVSEEEEQLAQDFESDFNYYLTEIATEYHPETSSMLMHEGYCGNGYKKVYRCPMRERPTSEFVSMLDLIVSEDAKSLEMAQRVTHQFEMTRSELRRMQIAGYYRDVDLGWSQALPDAANSAVKQNQGLSPQSQRPQDIPYTLWETDVDVDRERHKIEGKWENESPPGLPLPYKITVDQQTRQVLGVWRNWKQDDPLYRKQNMYVRFGLVPSLGFHHWGFLQILGNHTRALRAIWRLLIDAGMFSNFPGGIVIKNARKGTNEIAPNPGEWVDMDVPIGTDIRTILMPLPYKAIDAVYVQLATLIEQGAQRLGGAVVLETGEGKLNVPVGTIMAQIEQSTQVMAGVYRRNHRAQKVELRKIRQLFVDNPEDLQLLSRNSGQNWEERVQEFSDLNLVPASDPNVPSQPARIMQAWALMMVAGQNPALYDMREVNDRVLRTIRIASPESVMVQPAGPDAAPPPPPPPDPALLALQLKGQQAAQTVQLKQSELQLKAQGQQQEGALKQGQAQASVQDDAQDRQAKAQELALESSDRAADRQAAEESHRINLATEQAKLEIEQEKLAAARENRQRMFGPEQQAGTLGPKPEHEGEGQ